MSLELSCRVGIRRFRSPTEMRSGERSTFRSSRGAPRAAAAPPQLSTRVEVKVKSESEMAALRRAAPRRSARVPHRCCFASAPVAFPTDRRRRIMVIDYDWGRVPSMFGTVHSIARALCTVHCKSIDKERRGGRCRRRRPVNPSRRGGLCLQSCTREPHCADVCSLHITGVPQILIIPRAPRRRVTPLFN